MTISVCQGLPSCLESGLVEPHVLRLNLTPPTSNFTESPRWAPSPPMFNSVPGSIDNKNNESLDNKNNESYKNTFHVLNYKSSKNYEMGEWASLLSLITTSQTRTKNDETVYIHPLVKRSESVLSNQSLEMCTESLGSETGSNNSDELPSLSENFQANRDFGAIATPATKRWCNSRKGGLFPPPLPLISGSSRVHVEHHREGGRLVLTAVSVASSQACFKAERENGRLKLHFIDSFAYRGDSEAQEFEEDGGEEVDADYVDCLDGDRGNGCDYEGEDMEGNFEDVEGEICSKVPRPVSKCKEDESRDNEMLNLEVLLVATS